MTATGAGAGVLELYLGNPLAGALGWTDVSSRLQSVSIRQARASRFDDPAPGTLDIVLSNDDGTLTPDNPLSAYYPYLTENMGIRFTKNIPGGGTSIRFVGRVTSLEPSLPGGAEGAAVLQVSAVDSLGKLARRKFRAEFVERWMSYFSTTVFDLFAFDEAIPNPTRFANSGPSTRQRFLVDSTVGHVLGTARVVQSTLGVGTLTTTSADGIALDSCVEVTRFGSFGPVVRIDIDPALTPADVVIPFRTADRIVAGAASRYIAQGLDASGGEEWSLRLVDNAGATDLKFYDSTGGSATVVGAFAAAGDSETSDDQWYVLRVYNDSGTQRFRLYKAADQSVVFGSTSAGYDVGLTRAVVLAGNAASSKGNGKQANCTSTKYGAVAIAESSAIGNVGYLQPNPTEPAATRVDDIRAYSGTTQTTVGTDDPTVTLAATSGRTAFEVLAELARTIGAAYAADYSTGTLDAWTFYMPDALRLETVALTVDSVLDLDASNDFPWRRSVDSKPTRVTASWPGGSVTVVGDESLNVVDGSVETCAASEGQASNAAAFQTNATSALAATGLTIDLANTSSSKWADCMGVKITSRIRIGSLLSTYFGRTYADAYALGWTEEYTQDSARFTFDTEPADAPVEGIWDDTDIGRWNAVSGAMVVNSGTAVGTTSTGTIVVTTSGPTWSTSAGDYPLDVDWNGERVTVTSAPASSSSPQTLTITARGVAPSVARVHAAGESVNVWTGAAWTI